MNVLNRPDKLISGVTFGVSCNGNIQPLLMCLMSVLNARRLPHIIQIRLEGEFPGFGNYYFEQVAEFARLCAVDFQIHVAKSTGVRDSRDWHIDQCRTQFLWMGDNDVIYAPDCLETFFRADYLNDIPKHMAEGFGLEDKLEKLAYIQGVKSDLNNRRGYPDFYHGVHPRTDIKDGCSYNHRYDQLGDYLQPNTSVPTVSVNTLDTGNVLLYLPVILREQIKFRLFPDTTNCGGEDTLFALQCHKHKLFRRFNPYAVGYHFEKPTEHVNFGEFSARAELIMRSCDLLGLDKESIKKEFMPWVKYGGA